MLLEAKIDEAGYAGGFRIRGVSLELDEGELVVVTGKSGSGKTTLARALTNTITLRGGYLRGDVRLLGKSVKEYQPGELAGVLAYIPQEPWYGIIGYTVMSEFCYTQLIVRDKCDLKALNEAGLGGMEDFITYGLSAGQTQLLLWAEALATGARVIVMDEPLVYLDEAGRSKMKSLVQQQLGEGKGFVVVDHDPLFWAELRPRFVLLNDGVVEYDGYSLSWAWEVKSPRLGRGGGSGLAVRLKDVWFRYPGYGWVLRGVDLEVGSGTLTAVVGRNGSGKTTLLKLVAGLLRPSRGSVAVKGRPIYIPENPLAYFSMPTPWEELVYMAGGDEDRAREVADLFDLRGVVGSKLADLSSGERRRLAIASAYLGGFDVYLLDEPTGGLDTFNANRVVEVVERLVEEGKTVVIASHDDRLVRAVERKVVIDRGVVV